MTIPILVEPAAGGFRATAGSPLDLSAEAATAAAAVSALQAEIRQRLAGGAFLADLPVPATVETLGPPLAENPLWERFLSAVEEYRAQREAEEQTAAGDGG